jgi:hypothetical protein
MLCGLRLTRVVGSGSLASASSIPAMICPRASASPAVQAGCARARTAGDGRAGGRHRAAPVGDGLAHLLVPPEPAHLPPHAASV